VQLSEHAEKFTAVGISLVSVSYDPRAELNKFHQRSDLAFPLLEDKDSALIKTLGILNTGPQPGDSAYGIPYPGIFLLDRDGIIRAKFAEADFRQRPDYEHILEAANTM
jgi:peroxiredoxin